jgi:hypothetical protein
MIGARLSRLTFWSFFVTRLASLALEVVVRLGVVDFGLVNLGRGDVSEVSGVA